jgi:GT2 family glycosyltransferase
MSSVRDRSPHPALSVIVPTYERGDLVLRVVLDCVAQLGPQDELVVVDQSNRVQATARAIANIGDDRVRHIVAPALGLPTARNLGLQLTSRPLALFLDDDVQLADGCLDAHRFSFDDPVVGGVVGQIHEASVVWNARRTRNDIDAFGRVRANLEGGERVQVGSLKGCNMSLRRLAVEQVGGFDHRYGGTSLLEESDLSERLRGVGWLLMYEPTAELVHLSAPAGGVRQVDHHRTARWRFHNTGRFIARHRGVSGLALSLPAHVGIAARRAVEWREPRALVDLTASWCRGWVHGLRDPNS